jgi:drug/metabolite transporter (DMT)-like permease
MPRRAAAPYLILLAGVLIASTASIMIRLAQGMGVPSLSIAAGRLALAALILTPLALARARPELRALRRGDLLLALGSGAFLAVHFASWISSLAYTSVASSAALVATNPLWVGLASLLIFRERLGWRGGLGIALTIAGTAVIGLSDSGSSAQPAPLLGNGLALLGALAASGYLLIGRSLRRRVSVLTYIWLVYSAAAIILLAVALLAGQPILGLPAYAYLLLLGLAVGPQLLGHTAFNYALGVLSATFVAVALLGEPVGSAILAALIFHESVAPLQLGGIALLLGGIVLASLDEAGQ